MKNKFTFSGFIIVAFMLFSGVANANTSNAQTVIATGHGKVMVPQTIATFQLAISQTGKDAKSVQQLVRTKADQLLKSLKNGKTLSVETTNVALNPVTSYTNNKPKLEGYSATYTIQVKSLIPNAGQIIDLAVTSGVNNVDGPTLSASDKDRSLGQIQAIKLATLDAQTKANASLAALGLKPGQVKQINVEANTNNPNPPFMRYNTMAATASPAPATDIQASSDAVIADVTLTVGF